MASLSLPPSLRHLLWQGREKGVTGINFLAGRISHQDKREKGRTRLREVCLARAAVVAYGRKEREIHAKFNKVFFLQT